MLQGSPERARTGLQGRGSCRVIAVKVFVCVCLQRGGSCGHCGCAWNGREGALGILPLYVFRGRVVVEVEVGRDYLGWRASKDSASLDWLSFVRCWVPLQRKECGKNKVTSQPEM